MYIYDFDQWCKQATKGIKYGPDRKEVHWELYQHMSDRFEDFSGQDISYESAVEGTLQAMDTGYRYLLLVQGTGQ